MPVSLNRIARLLARIASDGLQYPGNRSWGLLAALCRSFPQNHCGSGEFSWVKTHPRGAILWVKTYPPKAILWVKTYPHHK